MKLTHNGSALFLASTLTVNSLAAFAQAASQADQSAPSTRPHSGNPVFSGWYADPEATIFKNQYWIYPTYSAQYGQQVFFDAFSSPDLVHWSKHSHILSTNQVTWARRAMWAPAVAERNGKYFFFFGANDIHDGHKEIGGIGVAVADQPEGPFAIYWANPW
jgi:beta-xylosidase